MKFGVFPLCAASCPITFGQLLLVLLLLVPLVASVDLVFSGACWLWWLVYLCDCVWRIRKTSIKLFMVTALRPTAEPEPTKTLLVFFFPCSTYEYYPSPMSSISLLPVPTTPFSGVSRNFGLKF